MQQHPENESIEWGDEIITHGDRPEWLGDHEPYVWIRTNRWLDRTTGRHTYSNPMAPSTRDWCWRHADGDPCIRGIKLPKDHPAYRLVRANARLIAAAPELFEALRNLVDRHFLNGGKLTDPAYIAAKDALAKAREQSQ